MKADTGKEGYIYRAGGVISAVKMLLIRRIEAKKCANTGTGTPDFCCQIKSPIILPHGLNGIVIGNNVAIYQHVTIAESDKTKKAIIEDNVIIGAGAVILNNSHIGKGAKIGANAVVVCDVPEGATASRCTSKNNRKNKI